MSFSTFTHQYPKQTAPSNQLIFIDVDPKPMAAVVKEERPPTPDEPKPKDKAGEKLFCSECAFSTVQADRMTRHMRKHRGENPFQCTWCEYSTYNSTLFDEHVNIHKGIKPYKCKLCEYRSVSKKYIKKHESRHGICDACGFVARDIRLLRRHARSNTCGQADDKDKEKEGQRKKYTCHNCDTYYYSSECLKQHKKQHSLCPECGKGFSLLALPQHRKNKHGVKKEAAAKKFKFLCALCEWKSNCHQKILLHLIHHPDQVVDGRIDVTPLVVAGILTKS